MLRRILLVVALVASLVGAATAQNNRIDIITPLAPELASYGQYDIGVRTIQVTDKNRPDILNIKEGGPTARYDRSLTLEVWYPAALVAGAALVSLLLRETHGRNVWEGRAARKT